MADTQSTPSILFIGDYHRGTELARRHEPFDALIVAAVLRADTSNFARLRMAFPELVAETQRRYDSPGGALTFDEWKAAYGEDHDDATLRYVAKKLGGVA